MQDSPIQIGSINLQDFEIPPSVRFGGRHRLAVHSLSNGKRVVERLGPEDGEIAFQGTFSGPHAEARVRLFDNLRLSGEIVWLTWNSFRRRIVVKSFVADYHSPWWIPYRISCTVVNQTGVPPSQSSVFGATISADLSSAISAAAGSTIQFSSLQSSLSSTNALITGTSDQAQAIAAVGTTLDAITIGIVEQSTLLSTPIPSSDDAEYQSRTFGTRVTSAGSLVAMVNTSFYVGRIGAQLNGTGN